MHESGSNQARVSLQSARADPQSGSPTMPVGFSSIRREPSSVRWLHQRKLKVVIQGCSIGGTDRSCAPSTTRLPSVWLLRRSVLTIANPTDGSRLELAGKQEMTHDANHAGDTRRQPAQTLGEPLGLDFAAEVDHTA